MTFEYDDESEIPTPGTLAVSDRESDSPSDGRRPRVVVPYSKTDMSEGVGAWNDRLLATARLANVPPTIFSRNNDHLVRVRRTRRGTKIEVLTPEMLVYHICQWSSWGAVKQQRGGRVSWTAADAKFHRDLAIHLLSAPEFDTDVFPELDAVIEAPSFTQSGRLVDKPGFDREARLWLQPPEGLELRPVASSPSRKAVERAKSLIFEQILPEFPFLGDGDRANTVAMLLQPIARRLITECTPLYMISAPTAGTGKSTLGKIVAVPATGRASAIKPEPEHGAEMRKVLTSTLAEAPPVIVFDNVSQEVSGAALAAVLTSEVWEDRTLGKTKVVKYPVSTTWVGTGNTPTFSRELAMRTVMITLDTGMEDPSKRRFLKPMPGEAIAIRSHFLHALLVLTQSWLANGRRPGGASHGRYPQWAEIMSGILENAGIEGFLETSVNVDSIDPEGNRWRTLVRVWLERFETDPAPLEDLHSTIVRDRLLSVLFAEILGTSLNENVQRARLREAIDAQRRRPYLGHRIEPCNFMTAIRWKLVPTNEGEEAPTVIVTPTPTPTPEPESPRAREPETVAASGPAGIVACTEGAKDDAEENYPRLLAELGSAREVARLGDRLQSDMRGSAPDGPGEALAERLRPALLKRGEKRFGAAQAEDYVLWYGINVGGIAEAEPTVDT